MIDRIQEYAPDAVGAQADLVRERVLELAAVAREKLAQSTESVRDYTVKQPARALGIALGMGVFLGWLIKRR